MVRPRLLRERPGGDARVADPDQEPLGGVEEIDDLPAAAGRYVAFVEDATGVDVAMVGTGPERERILTARALARMAG